MARGALVAVVFLLLISTVFALPNEDIMSKIESASTEISAFFSDVSKNEIVIVSGSRISVEDKILFNMIKSNMQELQAIEVVSDSTKPEELKGKTLVLLGSEKTNLISKDIARQGADVKASVYSPLILGFATLPTGEKAMLVYSEKEEKNNENNAVAKSPLAQVVDKKYVPIAATTLSLLMLYLWGIIGKTAMSLVNDFASSKILGKATKDKTAKAKRHDVKIHEFFTKQEIISLFIAIIIFTITMTWTWSGNLAEFKKMFFINLIIIGIISILREFFRQYFCYKHKVSTEYALWPFGSVLTIVSTYLGNTFSVASYTLSDEKIEEETKLGKQSFIITALTFALAIIAYLLNIFSPSLVLQMIFVYCIMMIFIEMFPLAPFAGKDIREWKFPVWLVSYILVFVSYIYMNFTLYV